MSPNYGLAQDYLSHLLKTRMVAERLRTFVCQEFSPSPARNSVSTMEGYNLRGAGTNVGFGAAMECGAKDLAVQATAELVVPAAVSVANRLCATRKKIEDKVQLVAPQEIVSTPVSKDFPVDQYLIKLEQLTTTTTDQTTEKTTDKDDQPTIVIRLRKEVQSVMERERIKWDIMLDDNSIKFMDIVMYEQRVEVAKTEEQIREVKDGFDDIRRVVTNRDEGFQAQLTIILQALKLKVVEAENEKLQENTRVTESLLDRDKRDGQPLCWARAAEDSKNKDNAQEMQIYTPTNRREEEVEKFVHKWSEANSISNGLKVPTTEIVDGSIVNGFDTLVWESVGQTGDSDNQQGYQDIPQTGIDFSRMPLGNIDNKDVDRNRLQKGIDFSAIFLGNTNKGYATPPRPWRRAPASPGSSGPNSEDVANDINNLNMGFGGNGDGPDRHGEFFQTITHNPRDRGADEDGKSRGFRLVNPRNVVINVFTGNNLSSNPYLALTNSIRRLILPQGEDGEQLLTILDYVETYGINKFTDYHFSNLKLQCEQAGEFDRAIQAALLNWTSGIAHGVIKYGVRGGLDAWRKLYNKYMPFAYDQQHILIRELMSFKQVNENEIDQLFHDVERICDLYIKAGSEDDPNLNR